MVTVLGATGFVGSHIVKRLKELGIDYFVPERDEDLGGKALGEVIYCIGLTSDFRSRPFETVEAHVCKLNYLLQSAQYSSFTYFSSTRVYINNVDSVDEKSMISIDVNNPNDLFNATKIAGELIALHCNRPNVKVIRLSNVYGNDFASNNFLSSIIKDGVHNQKIVLRTTPSSAKDYISIQNVVDLTIKISNQGKHSIYNLASGVKIQNAAILSRLKEILNCEVIYDPAAEDIIFPNIDVSRIVNEFDYKPSPTLLLDLESLISEYRSTLN